MLKKTLIIISMMVLSACTSMSFKGMYKMATLDPLSINPKELQLALRTNQIVEVTSGSVVVKLSYSGPAYENYPAVDRNHKFNVEVVRFDPQNQIAQDEPNSGLAYQLPHELLDGLEQQEQVTILALNEQDAEIMFETLNIAKRYKDADIKGNGSFSFSFNQSCLLNSDNMEYLPVDLFLKMERDESFFIFFEDIDVIEQAHENNVDLKQVNQCG